jgi:predicted ArsR family transcriptional regulator
MTDTGERSGTRDRVLALLLDLGPSTTAALSERLGLSPAAVRRHLDALVVEGTITAREPRVRAALRGRGRPARVWALTDAGHAAGPSAYDDLAVTALRFLAEQGGGAAVEAFAGARVAELEARYRGRLADLPAAERPAALAAALSDDGYAAGTSEQGVGLQLCQHHCPVHHVAREFPQLCDAETAAISRLLDVHVQRLATIAHGDGVCTTHIPAGAPRTSSTRQTSQTSSTAGLATTGKASA